MATGLSKIAQLDFSAGEVRSLAPHLIPPNGCAALRNGLLDVDSSPYRRGGSEYLSTNALGTSGLRFVWDGHLAAGQRTVVASPDDFGVLDGSEGIVNLGGSGLSDPVRAVELGGMLFIGGGTIYGGSRKTADYSTGTVAVTQDSATVTGTSTAWSANVDAGMLLRVGSGTRYYVVKSVESDTSLTLAEPFAEATASGQTFVLKPIGSTTDAPAYKTADFYATAGYRLVACVENRAYVSAGRDENGRLRPHDFTADAYEEVPVGARIVGAATIRDLLVLFTTRGTFTVANLVLDQVSDLGDYQRRLELVSPDLVLWSNPGIAAWQNALIVPATDGVWLFDGYSAPQPLSNSITPVYMDYVRAGYQAGVAAVHQNHLFLPVLDQSSAMQDFLVCRLDRPSEVPGLGLVFPWSRWNGHAASVTGVTVRVGTGQRLPKLIGAGSDSRVLSLNGCLAPSADLKNDADGSTHEFRLDTRSFATGNLIRNHVRKVRLRYELTDATTALDATADDPLIDAFYGTDDQGAGSTWGSAIWGTSPWTDPENVGWTELDTDAPEDRGAEPFTWHVNKKTRYVRFRFRSLDPAAAFRVRSAEVYVRQSGKD